MARLLANEGFLLRLTPADNRIHIIEAIVGINGVDKEDDNVDVAITLANGVVHQRVFMTPKNAATLLEHWRMTGEVHGGAFLAGNGLVLIPYLNADHILSAVLALLDGGKPT